MLVGLKKAVELSGLHPNTLRTYADKGIIKATRLSPRGRRLYDSESFNLHKRDEKADESKLVCYCRVSSSKQKDDLVRQVAYMRQQFSDAEIIQDVGSGLNYKRKGLQDILRRLMQGHKFTLIVAHRDRLCRFGFELLEYLLQCNGSEIMVLDKTSHSPQQELTEDLLAILHVFSCRMHGLRRYTDKIKTDKNLSVTTAETTL